jgi:hydrogenase/urease accessory protein HupE
MGNPPFEIAAYQRQQPLREPLLVVFGIIVGIAAITLGMVEFAVAHSVLAGLGALLAGAGALSSMTALHLMARSKRSPDGRP